MQIVAVNGFTILDYGTGAIFTFIIKILLHYHEGLISLCVFLNECLSNVVFAIPLLRY